MEFKPLDKNMSNGSRCLKREDLTDSEQELVRKEARRMEIPIDILEFNDSEHIQRNSTCYNFVKDKIYIAQSIFPDDRYGSTHPRDLMSIGAVLAHEYYGHRTYRSEYLADAKKSIALGKRYLTTPLWQDECRASITAAKIAPNLTNFDRAYLVMDAIKRAEEAGQYIQLDEFMKEVLFGDYERNERDIVPKLTPIQYVSIASQTRADVKRYGLNKVPKMPSSSRGHFGR